MKLSINPKLVAAVATFRAIGDIRFYLHGIYVEPLQGGGVVLVATNGHALCAWRDATGEAERSAVLHVTPGLLTACKSHEAAHLLIADDRLAVHTAKGVETFIQRRNVGINGWEIMGNFPDWRRVVPVADKPGLVNGVNPQLLSLATNALKIGCAGNSRYSPSISFWQPEHKKGVGITSIEAPDFFAVVMPIHESIAPPTQVADRVGPNTTHRRPATARATAQRCGAAGQGELHRMKTLKYWLTSIAIDAIAFGVAAWWLLYESTAAQNIFVFWNWAFSVLALLLAFTSKKPFTPRPLGGGLYHAATEFITISILVATGFTFAAIARLSAAFLMEGARERNKDKPATQEGGAK